MTIAAASVVGRCLDHVKGWLPNDVKICSIRLLEHACQTIPTFTGYRDLFIYLHHIEI
jgi:hypothetical protein